jgi:hypothetical protein
MTNPLMSTPRTIVVHLLPGDYNTKLSELAERVDQAEREARSDKRKRAAAMKLAEEIDELRDPANIPGVVSVTVRGIPERAQRQMQDAAPPRKGNTRDEIYGFDEDAYTAALVEASLVSPVVTPEQFEEWRGTVSGPHWAQVRDAALDVNNRVVDLPKSSAVSLLLAGRADESRQPQDMV